MAKISSPLTEIPIGKTEISVTEPGHPPIWTHRKSTGLIWRDPKFARPHWISFQKSISFVCAQISGIATGQTLQLLKKREIIAFFFFINPNPFTTFTWRGEKRTLTGKSWFPSTLFPANIWTLPSSSILKRLASSWSIKRIPLWNGATVHCAFVVCKRVDFYRKRVLIELCLDCVKQTTCCCSHKGWQQNSNRPHSQWCVGHLSHLTPYPSYLSCALCILLEQDNTTTSSR